MAESVLRDLVTKGFESGLTVISARDSNLQHEEQSQSINWRQKPSELLLLQQHSLFQLQNNICFLYLENLREMVKSN